MISKKPPLPKLYRRRATVDERTLSKRLTNEMPKERTLLDLKKVFNDMLHMLEGKEIAAAYVYVETRTQGGHPAQAFQRNAEDHVSPAATLKMPPRL